MSLLDPIRFACDLSVGDVIEIGAGDTADLIQVDHLPCGRVLLRWGVGERDAKVVSAFTGIVILGHFEAQIYV